MIAKFEQPNYIRLIPETPEEATKIDSFELNQIFKYDQKHVKGGNVPVMLLSYNEDNGDET